MNIDSNIIKKLLPFVYITLFVYILTTVAFSFLPKSGVEFKEEKNLELIYNKYDAFYSIRTTERKKEEVKKVVRTSSKSLSNYNLKAIYATTSNGGWVIIENKSGTKSHIISVGESLDSYILDRLYKNYVVFEKADKEYRLEIRKEKNSNLKYEYTQENNNVEEKVIVNDDNVKVNRTFLNSYVNDIDKVWRNISINEIRRNGKIDGFKIYRVNKNSVFAKLGLKKGDIIKSINNKVLGSYADAFKVYNNINKTKYLNIEILRNNEIMELNYEID